MSQAPPQESKEVKNVKFAEHETIKKTIPPETQTTIKQTMQEHLEATKSSIKEWDEIREHAQHSVAHMQKRIEELERARQEQEESLKQEKIEREKRVEEERFKEEERERLEKERFIHEAEKIKEEMFARTNQLLDTVRKNVEEVGEHFAENIRKLAQTRISDIHGTKETHKEISKEWTESTGKPSGQVTTSSHQVTTAQPSTTVTAPSGHPATEIRHETRTDTQESESKPYATVGEKFAHATQLAQQGARDVKASGAHAAEKTKEHVKDVTEHAKQVGGQVAKDVKDLGKQMVEHSKEEAEQGAKVAQDTKEAAKGVLSSAAEKLSHPVEAIKQGASNVKETVKDTVQSVKEAVMPSKTLQ